MQPTIYFFFFFNDTATTEIYTLSLHDALPIFKRATPDLVMSDMIRPEMDGIRLLEWMRQYDPEVPVIMVTAIHDISTALEAIRRGAYDYILKPFEKDQLFLAVGRALQHRRLIIENRNYQR